MKKLIVYCRTAYIKPWSFERQKQTTVRNMFSFGEPSALRRCEKYPLGERWPTTHTYMYMYVRVHVCMYKKPLPVHISSSLLHVIPQTTFSLHFNGNFYTNTMYMYMYRYMYVYTLSDLAVLFRITPFLSSPSQLTPFLQTCWRAQRDSWWGHIRGEPDLIPRTTRPWTSGDVGCKWWPSTSNILVGVVLCTSGRVFIVGWDVIVLQYKAG